MMIVRPLALLLLSTAVSFTLSCDCLCKKTAQAVAELPPAYAAPDPIVPGQPWYFVVSGDSRNCGDVVMPAIAAGANQNHAQFYWHLGDLRAIYDFDDDMMAASQKAVAGKKGKRLDIITYETKAWDDFDKYQVEPFGRIPFRIGIGNHETIPPKSRCEFAKHFASLLDAPGIDRPKTAAPKPGSPTLPDDYCPKDCSLQPKTYYHWVLNDQVDFIYLDNASECEFDDAQLEWFNHVVDGDMSTDKITSVVVGMHAALPGSISRDHSMNEWLDNEWIQGERSGEAVYQKLLAVAKKKNVYVLASHSHYFMEGIFNPRKDKLRGWIIGTAGAKRYALPDQHSLADDAKTNIYGYLLGTVDAKGAIEFKFKELAESDIPPYVAQRYPDGFVHQCFAENREAAKE
jgi:hypothetical protein